MNWYKAKTILIIFFLCTNIFLLVNILTAANKATVITEDVIGATVEILSRNGVTIDPEIIPRRNETVAVIEAENVIGDATAFAEGILGGTVEKNPDGTYTGPAGNLAISGNRFSYTAGNAPKELGSSPAKAATAFLKGAGFDLSGAERTVTENLVTYQKEFDAHPFFDGQVTVTVRDGAVVSAEGCWFSSDDGGWFSDKVTVKSITGVLVDYAAQENHAKGITALDFGYTLPQGDTLQKSAVLVPTWVITTDRGEKVFMDARESDA